MRAASMVAGVLALTLGGLAAAQDDAADAPEDLLTLAKGAVLVSASVDPTGALALIDGDAESHWSTTTRRNPPPYTFVLELLAPAQLTHVGVDGAGERPGGVAGGSAGAVRVEGSAEGPNTGYVALAALAAAAEGPTLAEVAPESDVRWLRFTVLGPQTEDAAFIYFDEVIAHGALTPPEDPDRFTGVYQTGRADVLELKQDGLAVSGCYVENSGRSTGEITGAVADGVLLANWVSDQGVTGTAALTVDSAGALAGVRYRQRSRSPWGGPAAPDGTTTPCSEAEAGNAISEALAAEGEVRLYGILFNHDSDVPRSVSLPALEMLREALAADPELAVDIEGHTDSDGADDYNLDLSDRRARSVVAWLVDHGIEAARLGGVGKGETEPVATNATADGKALNRRVEVVRWD